MAVDDDLLAPVWSKEKQRFMDFAIRKILRNGGSEDDASAICDEYRRLRSGNAKSPDDDWIIWTKYRDAVLSKSYKKLR